MFQDLTSLVLNIGTYSTKVGFGGDDAPKIITPSFISRCSSEKMVAEGTQDPGRYLVGQKYLSLDKIDMEIESIFREKGQNKYQYDYDKYETFVAGILHENLHINMQDYSILISQDMAAKPHQIKQQKAKIAQIMFEKLKVPNIFFCKNPVLSCFATGRSTAQVVDSGQNYTRVVSVHDGYALQKSSKCVNIAGKTISNELKQHIQKITSQPLKTKQQLSQKLYKDSYQQYHQSELLKDIKQHLCLKYLDENIQQSQKVEYQLPDRKVITIDKSEIIDPFINVSNFVKKYPTVQISYKGIPNMIVDSINSCDVDIKKQLYSNILMTGGNMLFGNLINNIQNKVGQLAPPNAKVRSVAVCMPLQRKYTQWIGGSIVTSLSSFQSYWVGQQEWKQLGASIIDKKCT